MNGELVAVNSIAFVPHNVISVDIFPAFPMTIAVMAKDNADPKTGMEYANTNIGDADFAGAKFIWTDDLKLDNTVISRTTVAAPPDGKPRPDFRGLNDLVPEGPPQRGGRRPRGTPPPNRRP